jgi:hypothetical protein
MLDDGNSDAVKHAQNMHELRGGSMALTGGCQTEFGSLISLECSVVQTGRVMLVPGIFLLSQTSLCLP